MPPFWMVKVRFETRRVAVHVGRPRRRCGSCRSGAARCSSRARGCSSRARACSGGSGGSPGRRSTWKASGVAEGAQVDADPPGHDRLAEAHDAEAHPRRRHRHVRPRRRHGERRRVEGDAADVHEAVDRVGRQVALAACRNMIFDDGRVADVGERRQRARPERVEVALAVHLSARCTWPQVGSMWPSSWCSATCW